ncbi:Rv3235 family protein [Pseudonocardia sp. WMMC193]|uniref:Rv3235 family protein n=1 Tax=Pseudonocardia sp. WMMC193 TaxID=2911965 RepID=UPI001F2B4466|nr:Rv3235 family protein [Pseudonocardia sp. WMMC193]MCF7553760.1 Rv3235 family protein [Pseudonocardia sp. WMMC193]
MPSPTRNHEENHNATDSSRPVFGGVATEPPVVQICPTCGQIAERTPVPVGPLVRDLVPSADAIRTAFRTLALLMEVLDGRRPWRQVAHLAVPEVGRYLRAAPVDPRLVAGAAKVVSFHPSQPHRCRIETASSLQIRGRRRALAATFQVTGEGEWICTMVRIL